MKSISLLPQVRRMKTTAQRLCQVQWKSGAISNSTKIGRLAKMLDTEILRKENVAMDFTAFGETLIGRSVRAMSLAGSANSKQLTFVPFSFDTPVKERAGLPSIRFLIRSEPAMETESSVTLKVASTSTPDSLGKRMHDLYLRNANRFTLRCIGDAQSATSTLAMALFNQKVESHKLQASISNELVPDRQKENSSIRAILLNVDVVPSDQILVPDTIASPIVKE